MSPNPITFARRFQLWAYTVGHGQLLLRSPKSAGLSTRVDVLFKNVAAIHLPTILDGLAVSEATEGQKSELRVQVDPLRLEGRRVFVVRGTNFMGYVVAGVVASHEDEREYHEPSHFSLAPGDDQGDAP
jgi:hypothetical protein